MHSEQARKNVTVRKEIWDWTWLVIIVLAIGFLLRTFVFQIVRVDGPSMQQTLHSNERMLVGRIGYILGTPRRGDVVVCHFSAMPSDYVKRIVGMPGDILEIKSGVVYIDEMPLNEPYVTHQKDEDYPQIQLKEDEYFLLGDNRANSSDSRSLGALQRKSITGRVEAIIWPLSDIQRVASSEPSNP